MMYPIWHLRVRVPRSQGSLFSLPRNRIEGEREGILGTRLCKHMTYDLYFMPYLVEDVMQSAICL